MVQIEPEKIEAMLRNATEKNTVFAIFDKEIIKSLHLSIYSSRKHCVFFLEGK